MPERETPIRLKRISLETKPLPESARSVHEINTANVQ